MNKIVFLTSILMVNYLSLVCASASFSAEKLRVAVVEFEVRGEVELKEAGAIIAEWMINSVAKTSKFDLQERVLLKKILDEQKLSLSGLVEQKEATAKIGEFYGVEAIITGSMIRWENTFSVTARLINASTGSIIKTAEIKTGSMNSVPSRIDELAQLITGLKSVDLLETNIEIPLGKFPRLAEKKYWKDWETGMDFVWIPKGCYKMGQSDKEKQAILRNSDFKTYNKKYNDEIPQHTVCVDGFWLGMFEVTNKQFRLFDPGHHTKSYKGISLDGEDQPVAYVSWNQAVLYSEWLTKKSDGKNTFRLPKEAEWEYACRAGTESLRFWGNDSDEAGEFANVYDRTSEERLNCRWEHHDCDDEYVVSAPVGSFYPNDNELYDMLGNVWEWTLDTYSETAYREHSRNNPVYTGKGNKTRRGGSWYSAPDSVRCSNRGNRSEGRKNKEIGFRLIRIEENNNKVKAALPVDS